MALPDPVASPSLPPRSPPSPPSPRPSPQPVADSRYDGQTSQGERYRFEFRVGPGATSVERLFAQFRTPKCETSRTGTQGSVRIRGVPIAEAASRTSGKETARLKAAGEFEGGRQIERYRVIGHFPDDERARGELRITRRDPRPAGDVVDRCTTAKRITWSADRLGVGPEQPG